MSSALHSPPGRMRPATLLLALGLAVAGPALADPLDTGSGLKVSQGLDPYAASPSGDPAPGTPGAAFPSNSRYSNERPTGTLGAGASTSGTRSSSGDWWMPGGGRTAVGLNVGRSKFDLACVPGFPCDDKDTYVALSARNMANDHFGGEIALVHMGRMERAGGHTRATGLNLSLVGKTASLTGGSGALGGLGAFGKIGGVWGRTRVSAAPGAALSTGTEHGFGLSLGAGLSWDFSPRTSAVLEWDRYWFRYAGTGRDPVNTASIGLQWRY